MVDDGSTDGSAQLAAGYDGVRVLALGAQRRLRARRQRRPRGGRGGGGRAGQHRRRARAGLARARVGGARQAPGAAAVATKLVDLEDPAILYSAGDVLRRDGVCEQRGRFERDSGRFDAPGEVFSACAGAALYRRARGRWPPAASTSASAPTSRTSSSGCGCGSPGWRCRWEPRAVARHAGRRLERGAAPRPGRLGGAQHAAARRALLPRSAGCRSSPTASSRWAWHAARAGRLREHLAGRPDGAAAARRVRARARRLGRRRRGGRPAPADPRAARGRASVAPRAALAPHDAHGQQDDGGRPRARPARCARRRRGRRRRAAAAARPPPSARAPSTKARRCRPSRNWTQR